MRRAIVILEDYAMYQTTMERWVKRWAQPGILVIQARTVDAAQEALRDPRSWPTNDNLRNAAENATVVVGVVIDLLMEDSEDKVTGLGRQGTNFIEWVLSQPEAKHLPLIILSAYKEMLYEASKVLSRHSFQSLPQVVNRSTDFNEIREPFRSFLKSLP